MVRPIPMTQPAKLINGDKTAAAVDRARGELRHGRAVLVRDGDRALLIGGLEALEDTVCGAIKAQASGRFVLLLNWRRAEVLGARAKDGALVSLTLSAPDDSLASAQELAYGARAKELSLPALEVIDGDGLADAAMVLARLAQLAPALMIAEVSGTTTADLEASLSTGDVLTVNADDILRAEGQTPRIKRVSAARVPLVEGIETQFIAFRGPMPSDEQVAVVIGNPDMSKPVPMRVHSSCLTGDVFGSLRCDCGEQLEATIRKLTAMGGGIVLYLAQEGRGIGLTNKLRAYGLQDSGVDTYDANAHLGFEPDERRFDIAGTMLADLGVKSVRLLTNNPRKVDSLRAEGIDVVDRVPLTGGLTRFNAQYLRTKVEKGGHFGEAAYSRGLDEQGETNEDAKIAPFPVGKVGF